MVATFGSEAIPGAIIAELSPCEIELPPDLLLNERHTHMLGLLADRMGKIVTGTELADIVDDPSPDVRRMTVSRFIAKLRSSSLGNRLLVDDTGQPPYRYSLTDVQNPLESQMGEYSPLRPINSKPKDNIADVTEHFTAKKTTFEKLEWYEDMACDGIHPDLFFAPEGGSNLAARLNCSLCSVMDDCLDNEFETAEQSEGTSKHYGIRGGLAGYERRIIARLRKQNIPAETVQMKIEEFRQIAFKRAWRIYRTKGVSWPGVLEIEEHEDLDQAS